MYFVSALGTGRSVPAIWSGEMSDCDPGGSTDSTVYLRLRNPSRPVTSVPDARTTSGVVPSIATASYAAGSQRPSSPPISYACATAPRGASPERPSTTSSEPVAVSVHSPPLVLS